jgi:hypothetical protein
MIYNFRIDRTNRPEITRRLRQQSLLSQGWGGGRGGNLRIDRSDYVSACRASYDLATTRIASQGIRHSDASPHVRGRPAPSFRRRERVPCPRAFQGARLRIRQCRINRFEYIIHFAVHLLVPEADYTITVLGEIGCSSRILFLLIGNAVLSPEFGPAKALGSEVLP